MAFLFCKKSSAIILFFLFSACSVWTSDYEDFRFKKSFSQKAEDIFPIKKDAKIVVVKNRGDELLKILTYESDGYELIGISEVKEKNKVIEPGGSYVLGGGPHGFHGGHDGRHGGGMRGMHRPPKFKDFTVINEPDRIIDVPLSSLSDLDRKYTIRFGREIGAEIIIVFSDSKECRDEIKSDGNISCNNYDRETNLYRMSFLRKKIRPL